MYVMSVLQTWLGLSIGTPRSRYGYTLCWGCARLVLGPGAMPARPSVRIRRWARLRLTLWPHRPRYTTTLAAAVKRVAGVLLVDQAQELLIAFNERLWLLPRIDRGTR